MSTRHYERIIVLCCFLFIFVNVGMPSSSISVYQPYITALEGIGDTGGSAILSARTLCSFAAMFFVNAYLERLDVRKGASLACCLTGAGFLVYSVASTLPVFFVGAALMGVGYGLGGMVGMTMLVSRWFKSRVGTAVGVASVGSGAAAMLVPLAAVQLIHGVSLPFAFRVEGLTAIGVGVLVFALLRDDPEDVGLAPFGSEEGSEEAGEGSGNASEEDARVELPRRMYVLLGISMTVVGGFCVGGVGYISVNMTSSGFPYAFAAAMVSVEGAALTLGKFGAGEAVDHAGPRTGTLMLFSLLLAGTVLFCLVPLGSRAAALVGSFCYGFGASVGSVGISLWSLNFSTERTRARDVRNFQICYNLGSFLFNLFPGALKEACGTYAAFYFILLLAGLFAAATILHAYRRYRPQLG